MALLLGLLSLAVVVIGVVAAILFARRQADEEAAPKSEPTDFVAPVSSGGYVWRQTDETAEEFKARVARENEAAASSRKG